MRAFTEPLRELGEFEEIASGLKKKTGIIQLDGCIDSQKLHMIYGLSDNFDYKIIVTYNEIKAKELLEDYKVYDKDVMMYPAKDLIFYQADIRGNLLTKDRISCIKAILEKRDITIITTIDAFMEHMVSPEIIKKHVITMDKTTPISEKKLAEELVNLGYERVHQVEASGQFAIRGGIIDIFALTEENPFRIELWGEEIDSMRSFDVLSQRSIENLSEINIYPATETILTSHQKLVGIQKIEKEAKAFEESLRKEFKTEEAHRVNKMVAELKEEITEFEGLCNVDSFLVFFYEECHSFLEFFKNESVCFFLDEPVRLIEKGGAVEAEFNESMSHRLEKGYVLPSQLHILYSKEEVFAKLQRFHCVSLSTIMQKQTMYKPAGKYSITAKTVNSYNNSFEALLTDLRRFRKNDYKVLLLSASRTRAKRLAEDLRENELSAFYTEDTDHVLQPGEIMVTYGRVLKGFEYPMIKFVVISESDIFGTVKKKKKKRKTYEGQKIQSFTELSVGDYVVHENHGLGVYRGIEQITVDKNTKDYMKIEYRDGGNLYILATGLDVIQKYASADSKKPKLNKLGTQEWNKTKTKVKGEIAEVARDLVELYAHRQEKNGFVYGKDTIWQNEFEELFPFEETEDQLLAIEATKADMESTKIMDRLVCGDVGYGKTEIAIRAAFKAVQENKQVVYLVPTTILAQQHYNTFVQRMKNFPVRVDLLSRFRTAAEQKKTVTDLKKGLVDIVIGTHRVLSKDIEFKDLGLLIIDEEQRFGVTHKEKIKKMKESVDVLTLTATPIPRTLHMSLVGIRDMSVLEEAPMDRMPIQTFVMEYNEEIVREAICRELARNGQVYYVYNRVNTIADMAGIIQELVPDANVAYAHGQMKEAELERIMYDFINGDIDVLVSTTIIETGLDISNVNTMIIHDSDNMGLSQLYQLRGRVGRSSRTAYAFLMYKRDKMLKEVAEKRLQAIREFTELGSGFKIAMKDLEIRGAGNILGDRQHGHMEAVGYDLYCKMLNEAVKRVKGIRVEEDFQTTVDMDMDAFIPDAYVRNEFTKLDLYKRIAGIENDAEAEDIVEEMADRFGKVPESVLNLIDIALLRVKAHEVFIEELTGKQMTIKFKIYERASINPGEITSVLDMHEGRLTFRAVGKPYFLYTIAATEERRLIDIATNVVESMRVLLD